MTWQVTQAPDGALEEAVTDRLVAHNTAASQMIRTRFEPGNLAARPVQAYAHLEGVLLGGCTGSTEDVWGWLTIDLLWVDPQHRGAGLGRALVRAVESQAQARGCRWSKVNTWEFQAPGFYERLGYEVYAREVDYPPGHVNHLMRRTL